MTLYFWKARPATRITCFRIPILTTLPRDFSKWIRSVTLSYTPDTPRVCDLGETMLLSLVIPIYNEADAIPFLLSALQKTLTQLNHPYEIVFVNDGSKDSSLQQLQTAAASDYRLKVLSFPRNFGH